MALIVVAVSCLKGVVTLKKNKLNAHENTEENCMPLNNARLDFWSVQNKAMNDYLAEIFRIVRLQKNHLQ